MTSQGGTETASKKGLIHRFLVVSYEWVMAMLFALPRYGLFNAIKATFLRTQGAVIGRRVTFYPGVWIANGRNLVIGDDVDLALGVIVSTRGGVSIGDRTLVGYRTQILSTNHQIPPKPGRIFDAGHSGEPITIENDVWIGANCIILPGVTIGEGAVIGAGSVVTRSIPAFAVAAGVPARVLRMRE